MKFDLDFFNRRVEQGLIRKVVKDDMVIYNYTDRCTYNRAWDQYTMRARGSVFNINTGEMIACAFTKFFNLGESQELTLDKLPLSKGYHVSDKIDGSLGIIFHHNKEWHVVTRGNFESPQAIKGKELLYSKYDVRNMDPDFTYLAEIIYPANKIIIDYGKEEKLVLLAAFHTASAKEVNPEILPYVGEQIGMEIAMLYPYTIEEMIDIQKTLPKEQEGFVVRFTNGLRIKIKGEEYMKISRMLSNMTPLNFWENMRDGMIPRQYIAKLPEEFRPDNERIARFLESNYNKIQQEILDDWLKLPTRDYTTREGAKSIGLFIRNTRSVKHMAAVFPMLKQQFDTVDRYIMGKIRPKNNEIVVIP